MDSFPSSRNSVFCLVGITVFLVTAFATRVSDHDVPTLSHPHYPTDSSIKRRRLTQNDPDPVALPNVMNDLLSSTLSSFGRFAAGGLLSSQQLKVEFAMTDNDTTLVAKIHTPQSSASDVELGAERKISVALDGDSQLNIRVEMQNGPFQTTLTQSEVLPRRVSPESIKISPADKGNILIKMKIVNGTDHHRVASRHSEMSDMDDILSSIMQDLFNPGALPRSRLSIVSHGHEFDDNDDTDSAAGDDSKPQFEGNNDNNFNTVREHLPSAAHVDRCQKSTSGDKLKYRKCLCDVISSVPDRLVCYTKFVSNVLNEARRLKKTDFATETKQMAISCTNNNESSTQCMERVASHILKTIGEDANDTGMQQLRQQMRNVLDNEDAVQGDFFRPSNTVVVMFGIISGAILLSLAFWASMVYAMRRGWFGNRTGGFLSQLSSVLAQGGSLRRNGSSSNGDLPTSRSWPKRAGKVS